MTVNSDRLVFVAGGSYSSSSRNLKVSCRSRTANYRMPRDCFHHIWMTPILRNLPDMLVSLCHSSFDRLDLLNLSDNILAGGRDGWRYFRHMCSKCEAEFQHHFVEEIGVSDEFQDYLYFCSFCHLFRASGSPLRHAGHNSKLFWFWSFIFTGADNFFNQISVHNMWFFSKCGFCAGNLKFVVVIVILVLFFLTTATL